MAANLSGIVISDKAVYFLIVDHSVNRYKILISAEILIILIDENKIALKFIFGCKGFIFKYDLIWVKSLGRSFGNILSSACNVHIRRSSNGRRSVKRSFNCISAHSYDNCGNNNFSNCFSMPYAFSFINVFSHTKLLFVPLYKNLYIYGFIIPHFLKEIYSF